MTWLWLVAALAMVCDHVGAALHPDIWELRAIGRLSWPLFALITGRSALLTSRPWCLVHRLAIFAAIAHVPHALAFGAGRDLNIYATLALGVGCVAAFRGRRWLLLWLFVLAACFAPVEYRYQGVALVAFWAAFFQLMPLKAAAGGFTAFRWWFYPVHLVVLAAMVHAKGA